MFQITGAFAEFERSMIRQRVRAGLKRAVEQGQRLGRPKVAPAMERRIQAQLRDGKGMLAIARALGCGTSTVQRVAREIQAESPFRRKRKRRRVNDGVESEGAQNDGAAYESSEFINFRAARIKVEIERRCLMASAL